MQYLINYFLMVHYRCYPTGEKGNIPYSKKKKKKKKLEDTKSDKFLLDYKKIIKT
jgi:hypothetical protein